MIIAHIAAIKDMVDPSVTFYTDGVPDKPTYPYAVMWWRSQPTAQAIDGTPVNLEGAFTLVHVGKTAASALRMQERTRADLVGHRPTVAGRQCERLRIDYSGDVRPDFDVTFSDTNTHPFVVVDNYRFTSIPRS